MLESESDSSVHWEIWTITLMPWAMTDILAEDILVPSALSPSMLRLTQLGGLTISVSHYIFNIRFSFYLYEPILNRIRQLLQWRSIWDASHFIQSVSSRDHTLITLVAIMKLKLKPELDRYFNMSQALNATGRPILFSICNWGEDQPWNWAPVSTVRLFIQLTTDGGI